MPHIDPRTGEVIVRIVYDGPERSGKSKNIEVLASQISAQRRGETASPGDVAGRTEFFDWIDFSGGYLDGQRVRCQLVSVPGRPELLPRRTYLLGSADAVVFVADASPDRVKVTAEALSTTSRKTETDDAVPVVLQANKQDLPDVLAPQELARALGLDASVPVLGSSASTGTGVMETFVFAARLAMDRARARALQGKSLAELPEAAQTPQALYDAMRARERAEEERKEREEAERRARAEAERAAREEAERAARAEAERVAREEADRAARAAAREEAERAAREEAERVTREEAERKAREEGELAARQEAARVAREEAERKAKELDSRRALAAEGLGRAREELDRKRVAAPHSRPQVPRPRMAPSKLAEWVTTPAAAPSDPSHPAQPAQVQAPTAAEPAGPSVTVPEGDRETPTSTVEIEIGEDFLDEPLEESPPAPIATTPATAKAPPPQPPRTRPAPPPAPAAAAAPDAGALESELDLSTAAPREDKSPGSEATAALVRFINRLLGKHERKKT